MKTTSAIILAAVLTASCAADRDADRAKSTASADNLRMYTEAISHDSCQGRKPFSEGAARAVRYIARQMEGIGLRPYQDGSYFQHVRVKSPMFRCTGPTRISHPK